MLFYQFSWKKNKEWNLISPEIRKQIQNQPYILAIDIISLFLSIHQQKLYIFITTVEITTKLLQYWSH